MENHYEYLKLDMSASAEDLRTAIANEEHNDAADQPRLRKIKSILLNEQFRAEYDKKLIDFLINGNAENKKSDAKTFSVNSLKVPGALVFDDQTLHDKYIYVAIGLMIFNFLISLFASTQVYLVVSFLIFIGTLALFYRDWKLLEKNNIATFSKWWMLISPVYLYKRANAKQEKKTLFYAWLGITVVFIACSIIFNGSKAMLEKSACGVVTDIYKQQFRQYGKYCKDLTITETSGKMHYGFAEISDGMTKEVSIQELNDGQIYVTVE